MQEGDQPISVLLLVCFNKKKKKKMKLHSRRCIEETLSEIKVSPRICCCADVNVCPRFPTEPNRFPAPVNAATRQSSKANVRPSVLPFLTILAGTDAAWLWGTNKMRWFAKKKKRSHRGSFEEFSAPFDEFEFPPTKEHEIISEHDQKQHVGLFSWCFFRTLKTGKVEVLWWWRWGWGVTLGLLVFPGDKRKNTFFSVFRSAETLFQTLPQTK